MWTKWNDIEKAYINEKSYYGVYKIRMVNNSGYPIEIQRVGGNDKEGIIYIGRAKPNYTLSKRIQQFTNVAINMRLDSHSGAETFVLMRMILECKDKANPNNNLQYQVLRINSDKVQVDINNIENIRKQVKNEEIKALAEYFIEFSELPPCNSSITGKWSQFSKLVEQYWKNQQKQM